MSLFELIPGLDTAREVAVCIVMAIFSMIASAGGIGGGPIYTSMLMAFEVDAHTAIALSKCVIFAGSAILFFFNLFQKSKVDARMPVIQWDLVFLIENSVIVGAILGALINGWLPEWFLLLAEVLFLTYTGLNMLYKGVLELKADRTKFAEQKDVEFEQLITEETTSKPETPADNTPITHFSHFKYINKPRLANFAVCFIISTACTIGRGFVKNCGTAYWLLLAANALIGIIAVIINTLLIKRSIKNQDFSTLLIGTEHREAFEGIKYYVKFSAVGFTAGIIAAALGVGGGLVKNPLMLSMGIPPFVARAASSSMIAFTAFSSTVQYVVEGQLKFSYSWVMMLILAVFFPSGYFLSNKVIKLVKSASVIELAMAVVVLIADCFVVYQTVLEFIDISDSGKLPGFVDMCAV